MISLILAQVPTQRAQQYVQAELERFQESLSRCVLQCQDDVKDKVSQQPTTFMVRSSVPKFLDFPIPISVRQMYGSGSFYHQAKIVRKTLIPTVSSLLYAFFSSPKSNKQKLRKKTYFLLTVTGEKTGRIR